jgi:two-component system cell cycle response regulator DivK
LVEDQEDNRQIVRDLLTANDYEMIEARDGKEAITAASEEPPDLILMDIQLPIMSVMMLPAASRQIPRCGVYRSLL